ncbi:hypothetical protein Patl1_04189 [Pistacia atlantica]|uniref:Uncharacterized protein n=1 Tax=Pistacia atlantica TaxID=434234 RepID=A0ACC1BVV4_9ROSI|nr:hypothetical protein Patl1_04189 [Pistacia atlantica]
MRITTLTKGKMKRRVEKEAMLVSLRTEEGDNDKEEEILPESHHAAVVLPNLENLSIENLPQLRCIWSGPSYHVKLPSLAKVEVIECKSLIYLFTLSVAQSLLQLKSLEVSDCESLKHLIGTEEGDNDKEEEILPESHHASVVLPNLENLSIENLPQLRCIWSGPSYHVKLPSLAKVEVIECKRLIYLFTLSVAQSLLQLKSLEVSDCESLKHLIGTEEGDNDKEEEILPESHHAHCAPKFGEVKH